MVTSTVITFQAALTLKLSPVALAYIQKCNIKFRIFTCSLIQTQLNRCDKLHPLKTVLVTYKNHPSQRKDSLVLSGWKVALFRRLVCCIAFCTMSKKSIFFIIRRANIYYGCCTQCTWRLDLLLGYKLESHLTKILVFLEGCQGNRVHRITFKVEWNTSWRIS